MLEHLRNDKKTYLILTAATIIIGAAFFVYLYLKPLNNYVFDISSANPDVGRMEDDGYYFDTPHGDELTEDEQKIFFNIPMSVKKGSYTIRVGYRSNAGSNISVTSKSNPWSVKCDQISLNHLPEELPGEFNMNYGLGYLPGFANSEMYITKNVDDLDIYVIYCGFQDFHIESVELIGNRTYLKTIWPVVMLILVLIDLIVVGLLNGFFKTDKGISVLIICLISALASIPLIFKLGLQFDDGHFLYGRFNGIMEGLRDGQFPVRIHPNSLKGYGYAVPYFYPELFLYPFGVMRMIGFSLRFVMYAMILLMNVATAAVSFVSVKRVLSGKSFKNESGVLKEDIKEDDEVRDIRIASICSFLYTFSLYRMVDTYSRGSIAEVIAIIFLPLVVTGLYVILVEEGSINWLVVGLTGLVNCHVLSCELVAVFAILLCIICFRKVFEKNRFIKLLKACGLTFALSAYFIVPFIYMSTTDKFKVYAGNAYDTSNNMLSSADLFALSSWSDGKINNGTLLGTRYTLGAPFMLLVIGVFVATFVLIKKGKSKPTKLCKRELAGFVNICFGFGVVALVLSTSLFPWKAVENIGGIVRTVFCMVQFPWRYLSIAMACFIFALAGSLKMIGMAESTKKDIKTISSRRPLGKLELICVVVCILVLAQNLIYFSSLKNTASDKHLIYDGSAITKHNMVGMAEYEPVSFDDENLDHSIEELQYICDENTIINPTGDDGNKGVTIGPLNKSYTDTTILIINPTGEDKVLYMPITYYKGYVVKNVAEAPDGNEVLPELFESEYGTVALRIPAGYYNGAHIEYKEPVEGRISELISVISILGLGISALIKKYRVIK